MGSSVGKLSRRRTRSRAPPDKAVRERPSSDWPWICCGANPRDCFPALACSAQCLGHTPCALKVREESCGSTPLARPTSGGPSAPAAASRVIPSPLAGYPQVSHVVANIQPQRRGVNLSLQHMDANRGDALRICHTRTHAKHLTDNGSPPSEVDCATLDCRHGAGAGGASVRAGTSCPRTRPSECRRACRSRRATGR